MNPNILKLIGLLSASGLVAAPLAMMADKEKDPEQLPGDSEKAKILQAEKQAPRNYQASPAHQARIGAMTEEEEMDQLRKDRQYKLDALNKLRNGF
jgi:hypothetical protein